MNESLALNFVAPLASVYVPVAVPWDAASALPALRLRPGSAFHSSALAAAVIDTATLCTRLLPGAAAAAARLHLCTWGWHYRSEDACHPSLLHHSWGLALCSAV